VDRYSTSMNKRQGTEVAIGEDGERSDKKTLTGCFVKHPSKGE